MGPLRILGIVLIVAGALALAYGGFTYTKETHKAEIGPLKLVGGGEGHRQRAAMGGSRRDPGRGGDAGGGEEEVAVRP